MDRYIFKERRIGDIFKVVLLFSGLTIFYFYHLSLKVHIIFMVIIILRTITIIHEICFNEKELVITNMYNIKFHIRYDEVIRFGAQIYTHIFFMYALKEKWIPLYFSSTVGLRKEMPDILARLEVGTGKEAATIYKN